MSIDINQFDLTYAAFLFPAIPLMMISFGNRYTALSTLIRKIHDDFINKKIKKSDKSAQRYLSQLVILKYRLNFVRAIQTLSGLAFIGNLITIILGITHYLSIAKSIFIFSVLIFCIALLIFIFEIQLSSKALKKHLEDLEEIN